MLGGDTRQCKDYRRVARSSSTPCETQQQSKANGRVSTEDEQDPTLSFPRQLANAERPGG